MDIISVEFDMKDLSDAQKIWGMEIYRDKDQNKLFLTQKSYIQKILSSTKPIDTPNVTNARLSLVFFVSQSEVEKEYMSSHKFDVCYWFVLGMILSMLFVLLVDLLVNQERSISKL